MKRNQSIILLGSYSVLLAMLLISCKPTWSSVEVARVTSPDGQIDATVTELNGGATTSFDYEVAIGSKGTKNFRTVANLYSAIRNAQAFGVNLRWVDDHKLRIEYLKADAVQNVINDVTVNGRQIKVELQSGIEDTNAPAGGMEYNLRKHSH